MTTRLVVCASPRDLADATFDAFAHRHTQVLAAARRNFDVRLVLVRPAADAEAIAAPFRDLASREVAVPAVHRSRVRRATAAVGGLVRARGLEPWETELVAAVGSFDPEVVLTIGPWLQGEFRSVHQRWPGVHLFEEDLRQMVEIAPQSRQAEVLRRLEDLADRKAGFVPSAVLFISDRELDRSRWRFTRSDCAVLPFSLDADRWPLAADRSSGDSVLAVGNFSEARNADGLAAVLEALQVVADGPTVPVRVASGAGVHPVLRRFEGSGRLELLDPEADLYEAYRSSRCAIVPASRATGFKTTILQAWTTGCPTVASAASAQTVLAGTDGALAIGSDPAALAGQVRRLVRDDDECDRLARAGLRAAVRHDEAATTQLLLDRLSALADRS